MSFTFTEDRRKQLDEVVSRYPTKKAATLPALWLAQEQNGWVSPEAMKHIADILEVPPSHVLSVATFYTMYWKEPMGRHVLEVCTSVSCQLTGGEETFQYLRHKMGLPEEGGTTEDGRFTLRRAECLASCGTAPMLQHNNDAYHENLTFADCDRILEELK